MAVLVSDRLRHFWLLLWSRLTELNEAWNDARSECPLPSLCFFTDRKNKMADLVSDWLRHFRLLLWSSLTELNLKGRKISMSSTWFVCYFSGRSEKKMAYQVYDWLRQFRLHFSSERNSTKFDRKQNLNVLYQVFVFVFLSAPEPKAKVHYCDHVLSVVRRR